VIGVGKHQIKDNVDRIKSSLPDNVILVAAAKTRMAEEVDEAIESGVRVVGYNYVQEAAVIKPLVTNSVQWHMIGHLQRNKAKKAVELFDMIETIDSVRNNASIN